MTLRDALERVVAAAEALEADDVEEAQALLYDLENDVAAEVDPSPPRYACACGARFAWPGLLERHAVDCRQAWAWELAP